MTPFAVDGLELETGSNRTVKAEYEILSNYELWESFGGDLSDFEGFDDPEDFLVAILEGVILRPREQKDGVIAHNILE